jgi:hypothetical protein
MTVQLGVTVTRESQIGTISLQFEEADFEGAGTSAQAESNGFNLRIATDFLPRLLLINLATADSLIGEMRAAFQSNISNAQVVTTPLILDNATGICTINLTWDGQRGTGVGSFTITPLEISNQEAGQKSPKPKRPSIPRLTIPTRGSPSP